MAKTDWKYNDLVTEQEMNELGQEINGLATDGVAVKESVDAATNIATGGALVKRDPDGRAQVVDPLVAADIANKGYVDTAIANATVPDASLTVKGKVQLSSATDSVSEALAATPAAVKAAYDRADQAFTQASNGKSAVAAAITGMGQAASGSDTFAQLAAKIGDISKDATVAAGEVLSGKTFYQGGAKKTGTMPHITSGSDPAQGVGQWPDGSLAVYPSAGYRKGGAGEGEIKVSPAQLQAADGDLSAANIRSDKVIFGVQGNIPIFGGGHYVTPEFTSWDGAVFFRPNSAGGNGKILFEGDSWIRGDEPNFLASNIRAGVSLFGKVGTAPENAYFASGTASFVHHRTIGSYRVMDIDVPFQVDGCLFRGGYNNGEYDNFGWGGYFLDQTNNLRGGTLTANGGNWSPCTAGNYLLRKISYMQWGSTPPPSVGILWYAWGSRL